VWGFPYDSNPQTTMNKKFFKTKSDIANPEYDGRCKYGAKSIKVLKSGTILERYTEVLNIAGVNVDIHHYYGNDGKQYTSEMFKNVELEEIEEIDPVKQFEFEFGYASTRNLVKHLLKKQIITMDQVRDFYNNPIEE
jgi:hypothetical protein